jgi:hypothetical protein
MFKRKKDKKKIDLIPANLGRPLTAKELDLLRPIADRVSYFRNHFCKAVSIKVTDEVFQKISQELSPHQQEIFNMILLERLKFEEEDHQRWLMTLEQIQEIRQNLSPYQQGVLDEILERSGTDEEGDPWWAYLDNVIQDIKRHLTPIQKKSLIHILYRSRYRETELRKWSTNLMRGAQDHTPYDPDVHAVLKAMIKHGSFYLDK